MIRSSFCRPTTYRTCVSPGRVVPSSAQPLLISIAAEILRMRRTLSSTRPACFRSAGIRTSSSCWGSFSWLFIRPQGGSEAGWLPNFRGVVLGCMDSYDSEKRRILQGFSRSTRFAFLCTAPNSNLQSFAQLISVIFLVILQNFAEFSFRSVIFRRDFHRNLPDFSEIADICRN